MRPIRLVAIDAINEFKEKIRTLNWEDGEGYNLYKAWVELRKHNNGHIVSFNEWRNQICYLINDLKDAYLFDSNIFQRSHYVESCNLHISIHIMGGFKKYPKWTTKCSIMVCEH